MYPEHVFIVKALSQNYVQSCTNHVNTPIALFLIKKFQLNSEFRMFI